MLTNFCKAVRGLWSASRFLVECPLHGHSQTIPGCCSLHSGLPWSMTTVLVTLLTHSEMKMHGVKRPSANRHFCLPVAKSSNPSWTHYRFKPSLSFQARQIATTPSSFYMFWLFFYLACHLYNKFWGKLIQIINSTYSGEHQVQN